MLFSVLALQPCINFKVFYINFCSFSKRLINEKQIFGYAHLEKMQNAKKPIHRFYRLRLALAVDTMVFNVCRFIIVSLAGPLCSSGLF